MHANLDSPRLGASAAGAYPKTKRRVLTRRGVLWLGQTCNLRCYFCYFVNRIADVDHPEHAFMGLDKAKAICRVLRTFYGNTALDIQGGEPTIYREILELVRYCREIGLYPTLITNGLALAKPGVLEQYREAGIRDFLVSLHGFGEVHDEVVGRKGAHDLMAAAIDRMRELEIPFRFNCTMSKPVVPQLVDVAKKAIEYGAYVMNFIAFNPFNDQKDGERSAEGVPEYSEIKTHLTQALDILEEAGIEANVRFVPYCFAEPRHRKDFYNFQQLPYDTHEWDYESWLWTMMQPQMMRDGGLIIPYRLGPFSRRIYRGPALRIRDFCAAHPVTARLAFGAQRGMARAAQAVLGKKALYRREAQIRAGADCQYVYHTACYQCHAKGICDGFHGDYAQFFGTEEATPITDIPPTKDPLYFIQHQEKVVEPEDEPWAL